MTDDDLHLADQLQARARAVRATPDLGDVERRAADRRRRRARGAGAGLALLAMLGTVGGFALGRASGENTTETIAATGQPLGGSGSSPDMVPTESEGLLGLTDFAHPFPLLSERTNPGGVHLRVHATPRGQGEAEPCRPDRLVRVGVEQEGATGIVALPVDRPGPTYAGTLALTGLVEEEPVLVALVVTDAPHVSATFPNGFVDEADTVEGLAVLAGPATPGQGQDGYDGLYQGVEVDGLAAGQPTLIQGQGQTACTESGDGTATPTTALGETATAMPTPGEQPADADAARAAVVASWEAAYSPDLSAEQKAPHFERPDVWRAANQQIAEQHPEYADIATTVHAQVEEVVFTAPDRASVRFRMLSDDPRNTLPPDQIGEAVLVDGTWRVSTATSCALIALAGIHCAT